MIIDSDVLIWYFRGNIKAQTAILENIPFHISVVTYMELVQGMRNKAELKLFHKQLQRWLINIIHINPDISARAMFLVDSFSLSHSMEMADALIAATCIHAKELLLTGNDKHYHFIPQIQIKKFKPE